MLVRTEVGGITKAIKSSEMRICIIDSRVKKTYKKVKAVLKQHLDGEENITITKVQIQRPKGEPSKTNS